MMKGKKLLALFLTLVLTFAALSGCSNSDDKDNSSQAPSQGTEESNPPTQGGKKELSDITIAYVTSDLTTQIFRDQVTAMQKYCDEIGVNFVYTATQETTDQLTACDNYIAMGVDCLIVHTTGDTFQDTMKNCQAAGIPWFSYDTKMEGDDAYYGWENYALGYAIGQNAAEWINETFSEDDTIYAASNNYPQADFLVTREQGYLDAVNELAKCKVEWVVEAPGGMIDNGVTAGDNFIQCGYDMNLVCAINDSGLCGVYQAFQAANYGDPATLGLFGCDSDPEALEAIAEGGIYKGTINTGLVRLAPDFIDIAVGLAQGDESAKGDHWGDFVLITKDNVEEWMQS